MYYFLDSSALIKRYHTETGTEKIDEIIDQRDVEIIISSLALSEVTSALNRKKNEGRISHKFLTDLLVEFYREVLDKFTVISLDDSLVSRSIDLILRRNLRTLDSLQLGVALSVFELLPEKEFRFVSSDKRLLQVAKQEGLDIFDPETD